MSEVKKETSVLRKEMDAIGEAIYTSWLRDCDRVFFIIKSTSMIKQIISKTSIEEYFQQKEDFNYFLNNFSTQVITNILRQTTVYGPNGEDLAFELLTQYVYLFIKFIDNPDYIPLWKTIKDIFDYTKPFYSLPVNIKNQNSKKLISADEFNNTILPKINLEHIQIKPGQEIDVLIDSKDKLNKLKAWTRGIVCDTFEDYFTVQVLISDPSSLAIKYNSFEYREKGAMTPDWEWRMNLKIGDMIDCYERREFYPGTIANKIVHSQNGLINIIYNISFRVYEDKVGDLTPYQKFWPLKEPMTDNSGRKYLGDPDNFNENLHMFSRYIYPPNTKLKADLAHKRIDIFEDSYYIDNEIRDVDDQGNKTISIARSNCYSYYFNSLINNFGRAKGYETILAVLSNKTNQLNELFPIINYILKMSSGFLYKGVIIEIATSLKEGIFTSLSSMTNSDLRNIKREHLDLIIEVMSFYLGVLLGEDKRDEIIEEFSLSFAIKMIQTTYLDKRNNAVKTIIDLIRESKNNPVKEKKILDSIEKYKIFYEIYGPNSHVQLITKSKELLEIMVQNDKLSDEEIEMIWGATKKGDLDGKLTILKILKELSNLLKQWHIAKLLDNILNSNPSDLIDEEIDFIYELSVNQNDETMTERCIHFFIRFLFESNIDEGPRTESLVIKIYDITKIHPTPKINVIKMALDSLEENKNAIIGMKILSAYISGPNIDNDYDFDRLLIEDNKLINLYISSFKKYIDYVRLKKANIQDDKEKEKDIDTLTLNDRFNHSQNIKGRIQFLNSLVKANLWKVDIDPIDYLYQTIAENPLSYKDEQQFYKWLKEIIFSSSFETEMKLFKLFTDKICNISPSSSNNDKIEDLGNSNKRSISHLSIEAFDTFLKVFNDINLKTQKIIQKENENKQLVSIVIVKPEELDGFNILWRIVFESSSDEIMNKGIETLNTLFTNVQVQLGTDANENENSNSSSDQLIHLCLEEIKSKSINVKKKSLRMIKRIIEESEKYGTAGIISHNALLKRNLLTLKVISHLKNFYSKEKSFEISLYSNTTVYDLKTLIFQRVQYHFDFIQFIIQLNEKEKRELTLNDNGKTLYLMGITNNHEIHLYSNKIEKNIPVAEISINHKPTEKVLVVFNQWFDRFSTNNKMTPDDCARFVKAVTNSHDDITPNDSRVKELFNERDQNKDNIIEREEFIEFYIEATIGKSKIVYDNLQSLGVRNDLMQMNDPYYPQNTKKDQMPRHQLAINEEFFNTIFNMQTGNDDLSKEAFEFIGMLETNPVIYNKIISEEKNEWINIFPSENPVKLIYSLQIIESFIEGINKMDDKYHQWIQRFVNEKGFEYIVKIFQSKLNEITKPQINKYEVLCFKYLIEIIKILYISSLEIEDSNQLLTLSSNLDYLSNYLRSENLCPIIRNSMKNNKFIDVLMSVIDISSKTNKNEKDYELINSIIELCSILIPLSGLTNIDSKYWFEILSRGFLDRNELISRTSTQSAIRMCSLLSKVSNFEFIESLFNHCNKCYQDLNDDNAPFAMGLINLFIYLLKVYIKNSASFKNTPFDIIKFIQSTIDIIQIDIDNSTNKIHEKLFTYYIYILAELSNEFEEIKAYISDNSNLMQEILTKVLFKQVGNDIEEKYKNEVFVDVDALNKIRTTYTGNEEVKSICYLFVSSLVKNSLSNFEKFFNINIITKEEDAENKKETRLSNEWKNEGYVGLKNLGCICYMNSTLQQFFMVPTLRYTLLRCNDNENENIEPIHNIDDNMLHQIQRMFSFLELSERVDYNPFGFTYSFKDFDGLPTKISEQKDAQEFLGILIDRLENQCKNTPYKYMLQSVFGGKNCSQILCTQCGKTSNRYEDLVFLSLEVKNMKTLNDSLEKLISEEQIDGYKCEGCNQNVAITKRNLLATLPNVLIVHLQRIFYNFEYDHNEKINSRLEFPRQLNLKPYTIEEITRKNNLSNENTNQIEQNEIYFKSDAYYDYYLMGVIVHVGSADSGHYYSYININRNGKCCETDYDHKDKAMASSWLEFNDSSISKFDVDKLEDECFGGAMDDKEKSSSAMFSWNKGEKCKNAYMLVYERKIKSPIKIVLDPSSSLIPSNLDSVISYKEDEEKKIMKEYDLLRYYNTPEFKDKQKEILSTVFCDGQKNEYFKYEPFYYTNRKIPTQYYKEINEDNANFEKLKNISDVKFTHFFDMIISSFEETVLKNITNVKEETALKISSTFLNFICTILSKKDRVDLLLPAIEKYIQIIKCQPICQESIWCYIKNNFELLKQSLLSDNKKIVTAYCKLISELFSLLIETDNDKFIEALEEDLKSNNRIIGTKCNNFLWVINHIFDFFPKLTTKALGNIQIYSHMFRDMLNCSKDFLYYCGKSDLIYVFITFLLGGESPCYEMTFDNNNFYWDHSMRSSLIEGGNSLVEIIYTLSAASTYISKEGKYDISKRDVLCLNSPAFIRYIMKNCDWLFNKFILLLSNNNLEFTISSCIELLKSINEFEVLNCPKAFIQLFQIIIPILNIKDDYQQIRFEILLGIPRYEIEGGNVPFPYLGYHLMTSPISKYISSKSFIKELYRYNIIQKLFEIKGNDDIMIDTLILLFESCLINKELYKYILSFPFENLLYRNIFEYGIYFANKFNKNTTSVDVQGSNKAMQLEKIINQLTNNEHKKAIITDKTILPGFEGFNSNYLIKDFKKVDIELLYSENDVHVFLCDYTANYISLENEMISPIDFSHSKRNSNLTFKNAIINENNKEKVALINDDPQMLHLLADQIYYIYEKEFYINMLQRLSEYKKIRIESKYVVSNANNVIRRFIALNLSNQLPTIHLKLNRSSTVDEPNEYLPKSEVINAFNISSVLNLFVLTKINPKKEWTWDNKEDNIKIHVNFDSNKYGSVSYNGTVNMNHGQNGNQNEATIKEENTYGL